MQPHAIIIIPSPNPPLFFALLTQESVNVSNSKVYRESNSWLKLNAEWQL